MADYGAEYADKKLRSVDKQLQKEYGQAEEELKKKLADFTAKSAARDKYKRKQLEAGIITEEEYQSWLKGQVFQKKRWEAKIRQMQFVLHSHNEQAAKMIHENKLDVYNENYFHQAYEMEMVTGASFDLYSTEAVTKLIRDRDQLLPEWKVDQKKDYNWNYDKVNNAVTQGILQGESVDKIMNRLAEGLSSQNESKMRMFARTAITGAQSAGRQQQMDDAAKLGIEQLKQWLATLDSRTRDVHRHLDGQEVPFNESFDSDLGKIKYPGDPEAAPANVYNCRCTVITIYPKYRQEQEDWRSQEKIDGLSYKAWKTEHDIKTVEQQMVSIQQILEEKDKVPTDPIEQAKKIIAEHSGKWGYEELNSVGDCIARAIDNDMMGTAEELENIERQRADITREISELQKKINDLDAQRKYNEADILETQINKKRGQRINLLSEYNRKKQEYDKMRAGKVMEKLSEIRQMGGVTLKNLNKYANIGHFNDYAAQGTREARVQSATVEALNYYPKSWLLKSSKNKQQLCPHWTTSRAYYQHTYGYGVSEIRFRDRTATNIHELGHRMEYAIPGILQAEKEFYKIRTKGERLKWLGAGYDKDEKTRFDKFMSPYMGKDYGGRAFELVSMGFENIYTNYDQFMKTDPDMAKWILGILAAK